MTKEKLKDMLERCEKQFSMPTLFTHFVEPVQRPWIGLTEDEAIGLLPEGEWEVESTLEFAQAIEATLKKKNT